MQVDLDIEAQKHTPPIACWDHTSRKIIFEGTGEVIVSLIGHLAPLTSVDWSADGSKLLSAAKDDTALMWDMSNKKGTLLGSLPHPSPISSATFCTDGSEVATATEDNMIRVFEVE